MDRSTFTPEVLDEIIRILKSGDNVELKKVNNEIVVVRIRRRVEIKASITG